ncbi:gallate 1-beta-glucosyltransferase-like [Prosopis cineraria]|uniref:gallate 1-beta-glucosyltransferase-like n=1 Tax=Prosopis cineraria TaxID=364024 RepID=UPI00240F6B11|nr:gallate 1-beta-glucosyltransferase-like [Prosopis cineraria]
MGSESKAAPMHALLVSFPGQGHINPLLRLGKRLASKGLFVTFTTPENAGKDLRNANRIVTDKAIPVGDGFLRFEFFEDGWDKDDPRRKNLREYLVQLELVGKQVISQMIHKYNDSREPVSCIINNAFVPWVCDVDSEFGLPSAVLWVQSCAVFSAYYHYFHKLVHFPSDLDPHIDVHLPSLPVLKYDEIPSFLHFDSPYRFIGELILGQFKNFNVPFCVLMDTFVELEKDYINYMSKFCVIRSVGPLFKNPKPADSGTVSDDIRGDLVVKADDCIEWLNSKPSGSVVYVSFGSIVYLPQEQVDEIAYGLLDSQVSFLWVRKPPEKTQSLQSHVLPDGFLEKTKDRGKVVQWSPQEEVLAHPSVSCFVTHCGWNSSVEALTCGVPVLTFPAWGDQVTNAKFLVDVFGVGLRLGNAQDQNNVITRDEMNKCLEQASVGPRALELKRNALKWKAAAEAAVANGGSSSRNLDAFIEDMKKMASCVSVDSKIITRSEEVFDDNVGGPRGWFSRISL